MQILDKVQMRYYNINHVMITLLSFNAKTRKLRLLIALERQRMYFNSVFELRVNIDNIS